MLYVQAMYALHAASVLLGATVTLLGQRTLLFAIPSLIAVALALLLRRRIREQWLRAHCDWQLRTFGWVLLLLVGASLAFGSIVLALTRVPVLEIAFLLVAAWAGIRGARGWMALREGRTIGPSGLF